MKESVLHTAALTKTYAGANAVDGVDMTVRAGDVYGFIGQNGAGKTTLIRLVTSLIAPTSGGVELFGRGDAAGLRAGRHRIGCIVESPAFYPRMSAQQNLEYYRIQRGIPDEASVRRALETVRLADTGRKPYKAFSMGMRQRLGLALAILGKPDFLILDEPINGLDPSGIIEFRTIIQDLNRSHGMTMLISSHILSELTQVATTFGIIHRGRLVKELSGEELDAQTRRCYQVRVEDGAAAATVLHETLHTDEFEVRSGGVINVYSHLDNPSEITYQLSIAGVRVISAAQIGDSLEDYFLGAIGEKKGGAQA